MTEKIKIRLKDAGLMGVSSSNEAFLASKVKPEWQDIEEIFQLVKAAMKREDFDLIINSFHERGAIEKDVEKKHKVNGTHFSLDGTQDIRDYGNVAFNQKELEDVPELPLNLKKEILFLYYYGRNLDFYKVLNIPDGIDRSDKEILHYSSRYRKIFATRNFEGIDLIHYAQKLDKVRKILRQALVIEDPSVREKYNVFLKTKKDQGKNGYEKNVHKNTEKSREDVAEKHFVDAMKYFSEKNIEKAYTDIQIALHISPGNKEFLKLKKEIDEAVKKEKVNVLLNAIENDDTLLMDENRLEKAISKVLELTDFSPLMMIKIAESALEKEMPQMVIEFATKAYRMDNDLQKKASELVKKAEKMKKTFHVDSDQEQIFHIK